jgi:hypothetical protein
MAAGFGAETGAGFFAVGGTGLGGAGFAGIGFRVGGVRGTEAAVGAGRAATTWRVAVGIGASVETGCMASGTAMVAAAGSAAGIVDGIVVVMDETEVVVVVVVLVVTGTRPIGATAALIGATFGASASLPAVVEQLVSSPTLRTRNAVPE